MRYGRLLVDTYREKLYEKMSKKLFCAFFFLLFLVFYVRAISISPNVQFSFGCLAGDFPKNCSGNYYFLVSNLTFFDIQLHSNYSMWNYRQICRPTPFFQYVMNYSHIFDWECCVSNWTASYTSCDPNDQQIKYYTDQNMCLFPTPPPADNGTIYYCNYCSEDIYPLTGECSENSTQTLSYVDLNKYLCCDVTNQTSDCSILYTPYNETTYQACNTTSANIGNLNCEKNPYMGTFKKEDCVAQIPDQYMNEEYKCISLVKTKDTNEIVQVNPQKNQTFPVVESREYFEPLYSRINFYYTSHNLIPEKDYVLRIECSSPNRIIYAEQPINRFYENLDWIGFRLQWAIANAGYIVAGIFLIVLLIIVVKLVIGFV
jgi:hypothetical protein